MLDLTSMPRAVRDQIALLHVPADFILDSANFSPWDGTLTVELKCVKCGETSTVSGDPFGARWTQEVHHDCSPTVNLIEQQRRTRETPGCMPTDAGRGRLGGPQSGAAAA
jgi:hypothetical protein